VIINARPTKSTTLYTQVTGRGLRPLDEDAFAVSSFPTPEARRTYLSQSRKPYATIIDIVDRARRHELITLPVLWGLPAQIDAQGQLISEVAGQYEKLFDRAPRIAARARTAEAIQDALLDLADAGKSKAPQIAAWQMVNAEHWRLERPPKRTARDLNGRLIPHFAEKFDTHVAMALKIAPNGDARSFALNALQVDRRTISEEAEQVDVTRRGDVWVASYKKGRRAARDIVTAASLPDAIAAATVRLEAGDTLEAARGSAPPKRRNARRWQGRRKRNAPGASAQAV
jgi:hypothetical protein